MFQMYILVLTVCQMLLSNLASQHSMFHMENQRG